MAVTLAAVLEQLFEVIESRRRSTGETSYTARLMESGAEAIGAKIEEEAAEAAEAGLESDTAHLVHEIADLLYHVLVMASFRNVTPDMIAAELRRRSGKSGLQEKAERGRKEGD